jgi:hypothetical protein
MRKRTFSLILPLLVLAACGSTAGTPSAAAPSVAAPSEAPPSVAASPSAVPSAPPSEAPASVDPATAFNDETLAPVLTEISTALQRWGEAATAAAAPDAGDTAQDRAHGCGIPRQGGVGIRYRHPDGCDAARVRHPGTGPGRDVHRGPDKSSEKLLADDSASPEDVQGVIQQATDGTGTLTEALTTAVRRVEPPSRSLNNVGPRQRRGPNHVRPRQRPRLCRLCAIDLGCCPIRPVRLSPSVDLGRHDRRRSEEDETVDDDGIDRIMESAYAQFEPGLRRRLTAWFVTQRRPRT